MPWQPGDPLPHNPAPFVYPFSQPPVVALASPAMLTTGPNNSASSLFVQLESSIPLPGSQNITWNGQPYAATFPGGNILEMGAWSGWTRILASDTGQTSLFPDLQIAGLLIGLIFVPLPLSLTHYIVGVNICELADGPWPLPATGKVVNSSGALWPMHIRYASQPSLFPAGVAILQAPSRPTVNLGPAVDTNVFQQTSSVDPQGFFYYQVTGTDGRIAYIPDNGFSTWLISPGIYFPAVSPTGVPQDSNSLIGTVSYSEDSGEPILFDPTLALVHPSNLFQAKAYLALQFKMLPAGYSLYLTGLCPSPLPRF